MYKYLHWSTFILEVVTRDYKKMSNNIYTKLNTLSQSIERLACLEMSEDTRYTPEKDGPPLIRQLKC